MTNVTDSRGQKNDALDALRLAEQLREGAIKSSVFKAPGPFSRLRELSRVHSMLVGDVVRVQLRLKAIYRSRGVPTTGPAVYSPKGREEWLKKLPVQHRGAVEKLHEEYDALLEVKKATESELRPSPRKHPIARVLRTAPGMGPIRVPYLLPIVVTPHRFRTRRQFWSYCGLGIVLRMWKDGKEYDRKVLEATASEELASPPN